MNQRDTTLISCVRAVLTDCELDCTSEELFDCYILAHEHGVSNLLYYAIGQMPCEKRPAVEQSSSLKRIAYAANVREVLQQQNLDAVLEQFEAAKIRCLPLKGSTLKHLYPQPELRHMSDTDILIDLKQAQDVKSCMDRLGFQTVKYDVGDTDIYVSPEGLNFEIHRDLKNEGINEPTARFLHSLLEIASPLEGRSYVCDLSHEEHYVYVLCHIAKHLINGGVGIRPIMDVWICQRRMDLNAAVLDRILDRCDLREFARTMEHLAEVWFGNAEMTEKDDEIGTYILGSGAFGNEEQRVADRMVKSKTENRCVYLLRRLFPNYATMCRHFPSLKKCPILLPFYWICRWFRAIFVRRDKLSAELDTVRGIDDDDLRQRVAFFRRCGINMK